MADKLMRTVVVMSFFLILALFSSCGTNGSSRVDEDSDRQTIVQPGDALAFPIEP
jgi:hypothetical protein